jgi:hypothetical protein
MIFTTFWQDIFLSKIPSQLNKGLFNKLESIISLVLKPQFCFLYVIQYIKKAIIVYKMNIQTRVLSYKLVIEKQHILHLLVHHIQYYILNIYIFPFHLK